MHTSSTVKRVIAHADDDAEQTKTNNGSGRRIASPSLSWEDRERSFWTKMVAALVVCVVVGFSRSLYLRGLVAKPFYAPPERFFYAVHGTLCTAWIMIFAVQTCLVRAKCLTLHRWLGFSSLIVAAGAAASAIYGALLGAKRPGGFLGPPFKPEVFLLIPFLDSTLFAALTAAGVLYRKNVQTHKRLMFLGTISMCQTAFVRIQPVGPESGGVMQGLITLLFLLALTDWDRRTMGRVHPITLWVGYPLWVSEGARFGIAFTPQWQSVARFLISLMP